MAGPAEKELVQLEDALTRLASRPDVPEEHTARLQALQAAVAARRSRGVELKGEPSDRLSEQQREQVVAALARLTGIVAARKGELEQQLRKLEEYEERLSRLSVAFAAPDERRKRSGSSSQRRSTRSRST
jgi:hypothetical protein